MFVALHFLRLYFTPCKVQQPLKCMELQEKEEEFDEKDIGYTFFLTKYNFFHIYFEIDYSQHNNTVQLENCL